jgi:uncharacterized protein (DUF427 family)
MKRPVAVNDIADRRQAWRHRGQSRPAFAVAPRAGQESVWDYPRPPAIVGDERLVEVRLGGELIARSARALRVLETASPPTFYLPPEDVAMARLEPAAGNSFCEWKGQARYFDVRAAGRIAARAAWCYPEPFSEFAAIAGYISFYPGRVDCWVGGEQVQPQTGGFYGGWVTDEIVGPFKGEPGTGGW